MRKCPDSPWANKSRQTDKQTNRQTDNKKLQLKNVVYTFLINRNGSVFTAGATVCYARNIYIYTYTTQY